ncbi:protein mono-ADP-ribosyltransferase PARP14-like [Amphiura filiformis]|uniref:protein mono-ADP-ribosyltransferase PARP14-like n=1 Tax=Amphiura filiformis TaxID=82378 RepID=UPI003B215842
MATKEKNCRILVGFGRDPGKDTTKLCDKLTIYFQRQSVSGGCDVKSPIQLQETDNGQIRAAVVSFDDIEAANTILLRKNHMLNLDGKEIPLHVEPLFEDKPKRMEDGKSTFDFGEDFYPDPDSDEDLYSASIDMAADQKPQQQNKELMDWESHEMGSPSSDSNSPQNSPKRPRRMRGNNNEKGLKRGGQVKKHQTASREKNTPSTSGGPQSKSYNDGKDVLHHEPEGYGDVGNGLGAGNRRGNRTNKQNNRNTKTDYAGNSNTQNRGERSGRGYSQNQEDFQMDPSDVNMSPENVQDQQSCQTDDATATVEVSHIQPRTSEETVVMYFESKRKSGGGPILDIKLNQGTATITFENPSVAAVVANRSHKLDGSDLIVIPVKMKKSRPQRPVDAHRLLLTGIPDGTNEENLMLFIESRTRIDEDPEILYGEIPGTAMVQYSKEIEDIDQIINNFKKRKLQQKEVCASCVEHPDCILVQNLIPSISEDAIELYFESERKSGGGIVREIQMNPKRNQAIVFFEDWQVVDRVTSRQHSLSKTSLNVSAYFDKIGVIVSSDGTRQKKDGKGKDNQTATREKNTPSTSRGPQSKNYNDGNSNTGHGGTPSGRSGARSDRGYSQSQENFQMDRSDVNMSPENVQDRQSCQTDDASPTIEVSHIQPRTSEETVAMYFESKRKSGGGPILDIKLNQGTAIITFENPSVAAVVANRSHKLDGSDLIVIPVKMKKSRPQRPVDAHRLLLTGIPDGTNEEKLMLFIESRTRIDEDPEILYGEIPGTAMVQYSHEIEDIDQIINNFKKRKLQQKEVCASLVEHPDCILVQNLTPAISEDAIELYFESERKSGGGIVREVQMNPKRNQAIVFFEDWRVVDRVTSKQHSLSKTSLHVSIYFDKLGVIVSSDGPTPHIPDSVILQIDPEIAEFVLDKSGQHRLRVDSEILNENGRIIWPSKGRVDNVEIVPIKSASDPSSWIQWPARVSARLVEICKEFKSDNIIVEEDIWNEVCDKLKDLNLGNVRPLLKTEQATINLRGPCAEVENTMTQLNIVVRDLEVAAERAKQVTRKQVQLADDKFQFLFLCNIKEELDKKWQLDVRITPSTSTCEIIFEGMRSEVAEAQLDMYTRLENLAKYDFECSPNKVRFLRHVQDKIHETLKTRGIHAATAIDGNKVTIIGAKDQDTRRAYQFIKSDIIELSIPLQNQATINVLLTQKGITLFEEVNRNKVTLAAVNPTKKCIDISGFKLDVKQASDKIQEFIEKNVILEQRIPLVKGKVGYLMEHASRELQSISEHNRQHTVNVKPTPGGRQSGITVTGTEQGLKLAIQSLKTLTENIVERQYPVAKPGMPELLRGPRGKKLLKSVAKDCSCFIDTNSTDDRADEGHGGGLMTDIEILRRHTTENGVELMVCKGDLTREKVDAIVNAANVELNHIGGLAGDIVKKGGISIQNESKDIITKHGGRLPVGKAVFTAPGSLPCRHIIHVAGPRWERGPPIPGEDPTYEEDQLHDSVTNVLRAGRSRKLTSISIPAISSGVFGFPLDLCAKTIVEATLDFCGRNRSSNLKEIRFTNINQRACDAFLSVFRNSFGEEGSSTEKLDFGSFTTDQDDFGSLEGATAADFSTPSFSAASPSLVTLVSKDTVSTKENKTITLKRGDIAAENVNIIVNTTGSSMNLNSGGVSNAIATAAGPGLQQNCTQVLQQMGTRNVAAGDFIETGPANLRCQNVFHSVCESYRGPTSETLLRSLMQKIFQQANQKGSQSIAIPAIGTGNLAFPHNVAAQIMYDEAIKFSGGSLADIRFVVYHRDQPTIQAFEGEMQNLLQQGPARASGSGQPVPTRRLKQSRKESSKSTPAASGEEKSFGTVKEAADGSVSIQIGHITVQLQQGDLTRENTDAIVNSSGHDLNLNGPVSKAIVKAGGQEIAKECKKLVKEGHKAVNKGAVKTTAGHLPCRNVIHIVTPHSGVQLKSVVLKALHLADTDGLRSIAFPALGTGNVGGNADTAARVLLDAIGEFAVNTNRKSLLLVKLTIFQRGMLPAFAGAMKAKEAFSYKPQKGFFRKGFDYVKSAFSSLSGADEGEMMEARAAPAEQEVMILQIYAGNRKNLEEAIDRIEDFIKDEFCSEELPYEQEIWGELDGSKMEKIFAIAQANNVKVEPLLEGRAKRIVIQGRAVDVQKAKADIQEFFTRIQLKKKKEAEDQLINKEVSWRYKDTTGEFVDYGEEINPIIERAHREQKPHVDLELEEGNVRIDFFSMEERQPRGRGKATVQRADLKKEQAAINIPTNWIPMNGQNFVKVALVQGSQEFTLVQTTFQNSLGQAPTIHSIERIQVLDLYKSYVAKMERIKAVIPTGMQAERTLFHGTSQDTCDKINRHGFNRSYSGKNGTAHGKGTYFARDAAYSNGYAAASGPNNYKHMYMCKVLTGEFAQGNPNMVSPPPKPNSPTEMYDCVVDNVNGPRVFVVFHDSQAYPEYLISYT